MQAAQTPTSEETGNPTTSLPLRTPEAANRTNITQVLLRASEQGCNNSRNRFVPRHMLVHIIDDMLVEQLLRTIPGRCAEDGSHRRKLVHLICPGPGECPCEWKPCTGRRMIIATLLLFGREDLILSFLPPENPQRCDKNLPFRLDALNNLSCVWGSHEKELFIHLQWQVYTPFLTRITSSEGKHVPCFPEEVSLPWKKDPEAEARKRKPGEVSFVDRIVIYSSNHDLVSRITNCNQPVMLIFDI
jgi:hypothetical protein